MTIGFFDSGVGGMTVLYDALQQNPHAHYIYYADTDNVPYGTKSKKEIKKLVNDAIKFLATKKIDILVIACNTATSICVKDLRETYSFPIVGMEPAVKPAIELSDKGKDKKILVCATKQTLKQKKLKDLIQDLGASEKITRLSLQKLVMYAEDGKISSKKVKKYLSKKLDGINWKNYKAIVLGCTHFLFYKNIIKEHIPSHVQIIDGNQGTVNRMLHFINTSETKIATSQKLTFYKSKKKTSTKSLEKYMAEYGREKLDFNA